MFHLFLLNLGMCSDGIGTCSGRYQTGWRGGENDRSKGIVIAMCRSILIGMHIIIMVYNNLPSIISELFSFM